MQGANRRLIERHRDPALGIYAFVDRVTPRAAPVSLRGDREDVADHLLWLTHIGTDDVEQRFGLVFGNKEPAVVSPAARWIY